MSDGWGATSEPTPMLIARIDDDACDRLVAVFDEPEGFAVPLDADRPINQELFDAREVVLVHDDQTTLCRVAGHELAGEELVRDLSRRVGCHISDATEVLHLVPEIERIEPFVVVALDGSERAGAALSVAREMSEWFGHPIRHAAVVDPHDAGSRQAVAAQLHDAGVQDYESVAADRLVGWAAAVSATGGVIVGAALGHWHAPSLIHGFVRRLIDHDGASVVAVGPKVPGDWAPRRDDPIVVAVDASDHGRALVDELQPLLQPLRSQVIVVHVADEEWSGEAADPADAIARRINERWGIPVRSEVVTDLAADRAVTIAEVARREHAQVVVTHSWHRHHDGQPSAASVSIELIAHAHCPVIVFSGDEDS